MNSLDGAKVLQGHENISRCKYGVELPPSFLARHTVSLLEAVMNLLTQALLVFFGMDRGSMMG